MRLTETIGKKGTKITDFSVELLCVVLFFFPFEYKFGLHFTSNLRQNWCQHASSTPKVWPTTVLFLLLNIWTTVYKCLKRQSEVTRNQTKDLYGVLMNKNKCHVHATVKTKSVSTDKHIFSGHLCRGGLWCMLKCASSPCCFKIFEPAGLFSGLADSCSAPPQSVFYHEIQTCVITPSSTGWKQRKLKTNYMTELYLCIQEKCAPYIGHTDTCGFTVWGQ